MTSLTPGVPAAGSSDESSTAFPTLTAEQLARLRVAAAVGEGASAARSVHRAIGVTVTARR